MSNPKKGNATGQGGESGEAALLKNQQFQFTTKQDRIAALLVARSMNCFEAQRHGDSCLHSTIDKLRQSGFTIHDEWEEVPSRFSDRPVRVKRYKVIAWPKGWRAGA